MLALLHLREKITYNVVITITAANVASATMPGQSAMLLSVSVPDCGGLSVTSRPLLPTTSSAPIALPSADVGTVQLSIMGDITSCMHTVSSEHQERGAAAWMS